MKRLLKAVLLLLLLIVVVYGGLWLSRPPRTDYETELFQGVTYRRQARASPSPVMIHTLEVDLLAPGVSVLVTPGDASGGLDISARTTSAFLDEFGLQVAINGSFFGPFHARTFWDYYPHSGDPVDVFGLALSNGDIYSDDRPDLPVLCVSPGRAQIRRAGCPSETRQALAGGSILVEQGSVAAEMRQVATDVHPRTAVAVDASGTTLWLIVVDGRQGRYSEGIRLFELAEIVLELGGETGLNLDGGGSSTLVMAGAWGARTLNAPIHTRIPLRQRPVANHLGVYALPLDK